MRARSDHSRYAVLALAACASWTLGEPAFAQAPQVPIALTWSAPASCPDTAAVSARIEKLLGGPPAATGRRLEAAATVEAIPRGFRLAIDLTADGATSGRVLQGLQCESVADAAALVIALAFDPEAVAAQELKQAASEGPQAPPDSPADSPPDNPPGPGPADTAAPPSPPPPSQPPILRIPVPLPAPLRTAPAPVPEAPSAVTFGAFARFVGDAGSLSGVAPGVRAGLSLGIGAFRLEPAFEAWPSSRTTLADRPTAGAELRLLTGSLDACRRLWPWSIPSDLGVSSVVGCLGLEIGEMHGEGFGVDSPRPAGALWTAPRAALRAELALVRHVALTLDLGLAVPLDRRTFVLTLTEGRSVVHQPSPVSGRAGAGVSVRF